MLFVLENKDEGGGGGGGNLGVKEKRRKWGIKVFGRREQISSLALLAFSGSCK